MKLVRVVGNYFVAGFITDRGRVRWAAPILKKLIGLDDVMARQIIAKFKWRASVIDEWEENGPSTMQDLR
jgi:hypothetical protein